MIRQLNNITNKVKLKINRPELTPTIVYNSDIFIVEFPKSGITWFSTILANTIYQVNNEPKMSTHFNLEQEIGDIHHNKNIENKHRFPYCRLIKSHSVFNPHYRHVIYLVRNPFSVMNSYYNYTMDNNVFHGSFETFVKNRQFGIKTWNRHVSSWLYPQKKMKLHLIRYEDLIDEPFMTIENLYQNIGWDVKNEIIDNAIKNSSFANMKDLNNLYKKNCPFRNYDFVRQGKKNTEIKENVKLYISNESKKILSEIFPEYL